MSGSRRLTCAAGAAAVALLLAATLIAGCGRSDPAARVPAPQGTAPVASPAASPDAGGGSSVARRGSSVAVSAASATGSYAAAAPAGPQPVRPVPPAHPVPAAFRPAAGAPSDAEVRRELAQMAAIQHQQHQQHQQALSAAAANLAGLLPWSLEPKSGIQVSVASVFTDYGLGLACGGVLGRDQLGVAHKTAPCGTLITFTYAGRSLTVPVIDRGPYIAGREWDLTGATAAALAFPGLGQIRWSVAGYGVGRG
jgi:rare lipoprotein A (peptidoglycan hydrolase)